MRESARSVVSRSLRAAPDDRKPARAPSVAGLDAYRLVLRASVGASSVRAYALVFQIVPADGVTIVAQ